MNIVITGSSRGIGLELASQALNHGDRVLAVARAPSESRELQELLARSKGKLEIAQADLFDSNSPEQIAKALEAWPCVDVLINNAGIYPEGESIEDFLTGFRINSVMPLFVSRALFPKLKKSSDPKSIQITSLMGSIEDNTGGGSYAYRASKAALNMITRSLSVDEGWLTTAVIHPGWVQTRMGGASAPTPVARSAEGIWKVIHQLKKKESGSFFDFEGDRLPW